MENSLALLLAILRFGVNLAKVKLISGVDIPLIGMGIGYDFTATATANRKMLPPCYLFVGILQ